MAKSKITIVGLGLIGASIGLALGQGKREYELVGHDKSNEAATRAKKLKAVDRTEWNLITACAGADLVILAIPAPAVRETLGFVAADLKPGCVVVDTASLKQPVVTAAAELLPQGIHFVGSDPVLTAQPGGAEPARADLFTNVTWALCPAPTCHEDAIQLVVDLVERLGAKPLFLDAEEHDGIVAVVDQLPGLLSAALLASLTSQSTWRELRRLAGSQFETSTELAETDAAAWQVDLLANRENLLRALDSYAETLREWRQWINTGNGEAIQAAVARAEQQRGRWLKDRATANWDDTGQPPLPKESLYPQLLSLGSLAERLMKPRVPKPPKQ